MHLIRKKADGQKCIPFRKPSSGAKLFTSGKKLVVVRAPPMPSVALAKPFQRPSLKRNAYGKSADLDLKRATLGPKRRMDGMARLLARAGKGLNYITDNSDSEEEEEKEPELPFEPLLLWKSPHNGGEPKGLPRTKVKEMRADEYGVEMEVSVLKPAPLTLYAKQDVYVPPVLAKWLRPHQREGVQFMYECVMGLKGYRGNGVILADDMGLGKTLQSVTLIYTLLISGITSNGAPTARRVIVVCPCSLVKNWSNEFDKWLGAGTVKCLALAEGGLKTIEKNIDCFVNTKMFNVLIASYECIRTHVGRLLKKPDCCDVLVCDEAHRLKNGKNQTSQALNSLPVRRRVLLTGTPMQNDLTEFYAMVDFTNPGILGTPEEFQLRVTIPILRGRKPDATDGQKQEMMELQANLSGIVEEFILRRIDTVNAQHLPPKLVQVVCCNLTDIQSEMYQHLVTSKDLQHMMDGKQVNCLASIQMLMKLSNHPSLVVEEERASSFGGRSNRRGKEKVKYNDDEKESTAAPGADGIARFLPAGSGRVHPEWSGKMFVLFRLMREMRKPYCKDKIVIISNYTQTLDLIGRMCKENNWGFCRLDGSVTMKKRQEMVDEFNDPSSSLVAFLLSSKAGGCGLNLIGGNRLVLFDPDWNPAVDKQAAARCWRDGQKKRCFTYRFLATGTVEEKIFQRQLSKEGLQSVVGDKEQVNALSTKDLRNLFKLRQGTPSDTHDKLRCVRCRIIHDNAELEATKALPKKLRACLELLDEMTQQEDAKYFLKPLDAAAHGRTKEEYEACVKQPMDIETIRTKLALPSGSSSAYDKPSGFCKDVNRIFANVLKLWDNDDDIVIAAKQLQTWWMAKWVDLVPVLMAMKADSEEASAGETMKLTSSEGAYAMPIAERGDDYQEQIGMPDEENMRHWSHHHSVDTVDDPVFRTAMQGSDAVSFVFGLEVTWSLIQERQQAEEEKMAMEALMEVEESQDCPKQFFLSKKNIPHSYIGEQWRQEFLVADGEKLIKAGRICDSRIISEGRKKSTVFSLRMNGRDNRRTRKKRDLTNEEAARGIALASGKGWFAPNDYKRDTKSGTVTFSWNGFDFSLSSEKSVIQNAGKGLFLCVSTTSRVNFFRLEEDQQLDLGIYGPLSEEDYTNQTTHSLKNFLYDHLPAVYVFESKKDNYVIDPMDDATCKMNPLAHQSLLVYANETDGKALRQSIAIAYDDLGAVHYLLSGPLQIPVDEKKELYVDYSNDYEKTRVRFGYPRVSGKKLDDLQEENKNFESDFIAEVETVFSINSLRLGLDLVQMRERSAAANSVFFCQRALVLVLVINKRLKEQFKSCCNEIEQSYELLGWILSQVEHLNVDLKEIVVGFPLLADKICEYYQPENIEQMTINDIKSLILDRSPCKRPASRMEETAL